MLSPLTSAQAEALNKPLTRVEKLERLAQILERTPNVLMVHNLELWVGPHAYLLDQQQPGLTPMGLAAADPEFKEGGLQGSSVNQFNQFFETSVADLHAFSCNCGGQQTGTQMAAHVREIANRAS